MAGKNESDKSKFFIFVTFLQGHGHSRGLFRIGFEKLNSSYNRKYISMSSSKKLPSSSKGKLVTNSVDTD